MSTADPDPTALDARLRAVPALGNRAGPVRLAGGRASVIVDATGLAADARGALEEAVRQALAGAPGVETVRVLLTASRGERRLLGVASGKGGVGKSTLSANLAIALARAGLRTGLVDADIHGPSLPRLMGLADGVKPQARDGRLIPVATPAGVPLLSIGQLVPPGKAVAWRGPMAAGALGQLVGGDWAGTDTLVVDLPPGTGDVSLAMVTTHRLAGAVIVSTPQDLALIDAERAIDLFRAANVPVVGVIENMAGYRCPHCGEVSDPFGTGGAEAAAARLGVPFLGRVPLSLAVRQASDAGTPPAAGNGAQADAFAELAAPILRWLEEHPSDAA